MAGRRTIVAISSPPGGGLRAVLRLSGERAGELVAARLQCALPAARGVFPGRIHDDHGGVPCLWFWMPGPHSYTREDVAELHIPGAAPLVDAVLETFLRDGAALAAPGEFTRRAFENGRLDLTEAEGVLGLIEAADLAAARSAAQLLGGGLKSRVGVLRDGLEGLRALAEASLDFDTDETGHVATQELKRRALELAVHLGEALVFEEQRTSSRGRSRIVLAGRPNAGKSSLFNRLGALESTHAALVSELAGSTRDGKQVMWNVEGVEVELHDAPGFMSMPMGVDPDAQAERLADETRRGADIVLWTLPADALTAELLTDRARFPKDVTVIPLLTKADLVDVQAAQRFGEAAGLDPPGWLWVSSAWGTAGRGLMTLEALDTSSAPMADLGALTKAVAEALGLVQTGPRVSQAASLGRELSARHRAALQRGLEVLEEAETALDLGIPLDLVAETLREATAELDAITGQTTAEGLLDRIFAGFCLGK